MIKTAMQTIKKPLSREINFDQSYNLSKIKKQCYDMVVRSRRGEDAGYYQVVDSLESLNFVDKDCDEYKLELLQIIKDMIKLDDVNFDLDKLYDFRKGLSA